MTEDPVLLNDWHPVATVAELDETPVLGTRLLDEDIVVWRAGDQVRAWQDSCVHRGTKLSLGKIINRDCIQCAYHTPHSPAESTAWMWMTMNYGHDIADQELIDWQNNIFAQDRPILESQRPKCLPLDPGAEISVRPDKTAISYRRWLRKLGMRFGVEA